MTEDPKIYNEERRASSIDSAGKTGYHILKEWNTIIISYHTQKSTKNELQTWM